MAQLSRKFLAYGILFPVADYSNKGDSGKGFIGLKSIFAGGVAGAAQILVTYPIEYIKTQVQLDEKGHSKLYEGSWDCIRQTYKQRGFHGFYRGMGITLCSCIPKVAVRFYVLEYLRNIVGDRSGQLTTGMKLFSGMCAGSVEAVVAVTPFETIKVKFINDERSGNPQYHGLIHGVKTIIKNEGFHGIYLGTLPTVLKEGTNQAVRFFVVESFKEIYTGGDRNKPVPMGWTAVFGAIGGAASVWVNNPIDVIKTRMQGLEGSRYKGTVDCAKKIWEHEGLAAMYKGVFPRMYRVSMDVAITFVVYDTLMEWFHELF